MDKSDKMIRDMFLEQYKRFLNYKSENESQGRPISEEELSERLDIVTNIDHIYKSMQTYIGLVSSKPEKFGFKKEELNDKVKAIDEIVMSIYAERDRYNPSANH